MKFIIVGAGDVGTTLCMKLASQSHDVVLIEKQPEVINKDISALDIQVVIGNGASPDALITAGIQDAHYLIAVTDSDEVNIAAGFVSRLLNPAPKRIARVRDIELLSDKIPSELLAEYFDLIINPEHVGADYLLRLFEIPGAREVIDFAGGKVRMLGLTIAQNSPLMNLKLDKLKNWKEEVPILIVAVMRAGKLIIPKGDDRLRTGDIIYALTLPEKTKLLFELAGIEWHEGKSAMIWGGSNLARILAQSLEDQGHSVKMILSDPLLAAQMVDELRRSLILSGEGTDQDLLVEENVAQFDAFIAATPDEENNVLAALLAKKLGVRTSMAMVNKSSYVTLVSAVGVDVVVSSRVAAAQAIFKHIHSRALISESALQNEVAGFIEIDIQEKNPLTGKPIKDLNLPQGMLVGAIMRGDKAIIPSGDDSVFPGDQVVVFVAKNAIKKLEKLLDIKFELLA